MVNVVRNNEDQFYLYNNKIVSAYIPTGYGPVIDSSDHFWEFQDTFTDSITLDPKYDLREVTSGIEPIPNEFVSGVKVGSMAIKLQTAYFPNGNSKSNQYLSTSIFNVFRYDTWSVYGWHKRTYTVGEQTEILVLSSYRNLFTIEVNSNTNTITATIRKYNPDAYHTISLTNSKVSDGDWHFLGLTNNYNVYTLFFDASTKSQTISSGSNNTTDVTIQFDVNNPEGIATKQGVNYYDDCFVTGKYISDASILSIYNSYL